MKSYVLRQIIVMSKAAIYGMVLQSLFLSLTLAKEGTAQIRSVEDIYVTIKFEDNSIEEIFEQLSDKTRFDFIYSNNLLEKKKNIKLQVRNESLGNVLRQISKKSGLQFKRVDQDILVSEKIQSQQNVTEFYSSKHKAEDINITGKVTDENGQGLPGATIIAKGTTNGTTTDLDGNYKLNAPEGATIVVSFIGYISQEIVIGGRSVIDIQLKVDAQKLKEVVVVGYGTQERANVTGAISSVKVDEIDKTGLLGSEQLLQGRVAGVQVSSVGGNPGSSQNINIRGAHSIQGDSQPLFVIDGIPVSNTDPSLANRTIYGNSNNQSPLALINPSDIASIEVLKDASAAAIYGSRASNGVIIITTKRGSAGKPKVSLSMYSGIQTSPNQTIEVADVPLYLEVQNEARENFNNDSGLSSGDSGYLDPLSDTGTGPTDWLDELTRDQSRISNLNVSVSGGNENTTVFGSFGYFDQEGWINTSRFRRYSGKLSVDQKISKYVKAGLSINGMYSVNNRVASHEDGLRLLQRALEQRPYDTPYQADGTYNTAGTGLLRHNAVQVVEEDDSKYSGYRAIVNSFIEVTPFEGFSYKPSLSTDVSFFHDYLYRSPLHPRAAGVKGLLIDSRNISTNIYFENAFNYSNAWNDLEYNLTFVHSFQKTKIDRLFIEGTQFPSGAFSTLASAANVNNFRAYRAPADEANAIDKNSLESYIGRIVLNYRSKYLFNMAIRRDGSSRFADGKRYGVFPSGSFGWRISEEDFFPKTDVVSDLKARVSYGVTGSIGAINDFASRALVSGGSNYQGQSGISASQPANNDLTWETATAYNFGVDAEFFGGRVSLNAELFKQVIDDLLFEKPIHSTTGFTTITQNVGSMENKGWELGLNAKVFDGDFKWDLGLNLSKTKNKVTKLYDGLDGTPITELPISQGDGFPANHVIKVGESVSSFYLIKQVGIYQTDDEVPAALAATGIRAGDVHYEDLNNDGTINSEDQQVVGKGLPDLYGGITNSFKFKGFDLSIFAPFSLGNDIYADWRGSRFLGLESLGAAQYNLTKESALNRWTGPGTSDTTPRAITGNTAASHNANTHSSRWLEDGSFLKIKTVTLGYTLPSAAVEKLSISSLRIYFTASNLATFTKYSGFDPEVSENLNPAVFGSDNLGTPALRSYILGLNVSF